MWCGTPCLTATFPHGLVQSRRRIRLWGRRWRVASYQQKVVEMGCSSHLPEGPRRAGGDPAPGNVATTRLPEAGVREHPAPLGALRQGKRTPDEVKTQSQGAPRTVRCIKTDMVKITTQEVIVREHPAPLGALRHGDEFPKDAANCGQGAPRTARCIKTRASSRWPGGSGRSGSTPHR